MKLETALALFIWGNSHSYGNAFAASPSTPIAFRADSSMPSVTFVSKRISRGGATDLPTTTALSATVNSVDVCPETVSKFISSDNWSLLSARGKQALTNLITGDEDVGAQEHVYKDWPEAGTDDEGKIKLTEQVSCMQKRYAYCMSLCTS